MTKKKPIDNDGLLKPRIRRKLKQAYYTRLAKRRKIDRVIRGKRIYTYISVHKSSETRAETEKEREYIHVRRRLKY